MMFTEHPGYHTCNQGLQGNTELDVMEAGGGEMLKLGEERGWWEVRRDGEDEEGQGVGVGDVGMGRGVCDVGMGRGSGEARGSVWGETRKELVGARQGGQRWSNPAPPAAPRSAIAQRGISDSPGIRDSHFDGRIDFINILHGNAFETNLQGNAST